MESIFGEIDGITGCKAGCGQGKAGLHSVQRADFVQKGCLYFLYLGLMKKLKNDAELVKAAIIAGVKYAENRGAAVFEATDSQSEKILYIY